jgi:hypothetical protein
MTEVTRDEYLRIVPVASVLMFILGIAALMRFWPEGFAWTPSQYDLRPTKASAANIPQAFVGSSSTPTANDGGNLRSPPSRATAMSISEIFTNADNIELHSQ